MRDSRFLPVSAHYGGHLQTDDKSEKPCAVQASRMKTEDGQGDVGSLKLEDLWAAGPSGLGKPFCLLA